MDTQDQPDPTAYAGLPLVDALARAGVEGWRPRVLRTSSIVTTDYRADRLNLVIDDDADEATGVVLVVRRG